MQETARRFVCGIFIISLSASAQVLDHPQQRWNYFYEPRRFPHDKIPDGARLTAVEAVRAMARNARGSKTAIRAVPQTAWKFIGPEPVDYGNGYVNSGRIASFAIDPRSNDTVYAGAAEGGVWKTTDGGGTWTPLTDNQQSLAIGALAIDPSNPNTVYAGTGEENFSGDSYSGVGILKSTDGGQTWTNYPGPFKQHYIGGLAVHPMDGVTILAATSIGVYQSTDAGQTWALVRSGEATAVYFDPAQPGVAWAALGSPFGSSLNGVYRSTDSGATWTKVDGTAPNALPAAGVMGRIQLVNVPTSPDSAYAIVTTVITGPGSSLLGIYKTIDAGASWTKFTGVTDFCKPQCWYDLVIAAHPSNPEIIFAGGSVLNLRTLDGGATWTSQTVTSLGLPHADNHASAFTGDGARLYLGNDGGMWSSDNFLGPGATTWNNLNSNLGITEYYPSLSINPNTPRIALAGSQDNGTHMYTGQITWPQVFGGDGGWTAIDPSAPEIGYVSLPNIAMFRLTNLPAPTEAIDTIHGINQADRHQFISAYVMDPVTPQTMYYGTQYLYKSLDGGGIWQAISPDLTNAPAGTPAGDSLYVISTIAVSPANPNTIYTGSVSGALYQTTDGGSTWTDRSGGLPTRSITHVTADPIDPSTVYATFSGYTIPTDRHPGHVFKSTDGGNTWTDISANLPNLPVDDLVVDPDLPNTVYIGTDAGVMATGDGGVTWATLGTGFPNVVVQSLVLHRGSRTLRAATHGRSVWDYPLGTVASAPPTITNFSPFTVNAGSGAFMLTVTGTNFGSGAHLWWNGQDRAVLSATATQITAQISAADVQYVGRASIAVFVPASGAGLSIPQNFTIGAPPTLDPGGIVSSANPFGGSTGSPGALLTIYGKNLAGATQAAVEFPNVYPLPDTFGGVTVIIGNFVAPIYSITSTAINIQVPYGLAVRTQAVTVQQGLSLATGQLAMAPVTPSLFSMDESGSGQGAERIANTAIIPAPVGTFPGSRPAHPGEYLEVYCTGLGAVSPTVATGAAPSGTNLSHTVLTPTATVGSLPATVLFSGLTPGIAGLYVVDIQIPDTVQTGDAVPIALTIGNVVSNTVTVAIQ
jgi:uncharacterized protein (TIGR03437 family)